MRYFLERVQLFRFHSTNEGGIFGPPDETTANQNYQNMLLNYTIKLLMVLLWIGVKTIATALLDPVKSLRSE